MTFLISGDFPLYFLETHCLVSEQRNDLFLSGSLIRNRVTHLTEKRVAMKRFFSPLLLRLGTLLYVLGCTLLVVSAFFFPAYITGTWDGHRYNYHSYSVWSETNSYSFNQFMSLPLVAICLVLLFDAVLVALPLLSACFVLGTSTVRLFRESSARIATWRRRTARMGLIGAVLGLIMLCLQGAVTETLGAINALQSLGVGFGLVLLGFCIMIVSASSLIRSGD